MIETFGAIIAPMGISTPPELMLLRTLILAVLTVVMIIIIILVGEAIGNLRK
ncbi:MAG: hypothetical protein WA103_04275 [Minisyncoccales bacterium]